MKHIDKQSVLICIEQLVKNAESGDLKKPDGICYTSYVLFGCLIVVNLYIVAARVVKLKSPAFHYYMHFSLVSENVFYLVAVSKYQ